MAVHVWQNERDASEANVQTMQTHIDPYSVRYFSLLMREKF